MSADNTSMDMSDTSMDMKQGRQKTPGSKSVGITLQRSQGLKCIGLALQRFHGLKSMGIAPGA